MTRRLIAALTIAAILALALTLLWSVWVHHTHATPYEHEDPVVVMLGSQAA